MAEFILVLLRILHAVAALVWLGGGIYYLVAIVPATREDSGSSSAFVARAQREFGEWAGPSTYIMLGTGMVLGFDQLSQGQGGLLYPVLLGLKVLSAIVAFWLVSLRRGRKRSRPGWQSRTDVIIGLGLFAFVVGVMISTIWA